MPASEFVVYDVRFLPLDGSGNPITAAPQSRRVAGIANAEEAIACLARCVDGEEFLGVTCDGVRIVEVRLLTGIDIVDEPVFTAAE